MKKTLSRLREIPATLADTAILAPVESLYRFRVPNSYLQLIDHLDPRDPIRALVIPDVRELEPLGTLDPTNEAKYTVLPGLQHKFPNTGLLLVTRNCAGYFRYCFRKRLFQSTSDEVPRSLDSAFQYIAEHPEITNVILSGGDALSLPTPRLFAILEMICRIESVRVVRIGSKSPAFDPERIIEDKDLLAGLEGLDVYGKQFYLMAHFDHPREVTEKASQSIRLLARAGMTCLNQCPLINGLNSDAGVLSELFEKMAFLGCPQYYVFHCRPTAGNSHFVIPLKQAFEIFERETRAGSGLSKTARYCYAHPEAKLQILCLEGDRALVKVLQSHYASATGATFWHNIADSLDSIKISSIT